MTINEVIVDFPAPEQDNLRHIRRNASADESEETETQSDEFEQEEPIEVPEEDMAAIPQDEEDQASDTEEFTMEKSLTINATGHARTGMQNTAKRCFSRKMV